MTFEHIADIEKLLKKYGFSLDRYQDSVITRWNLYYNNSGGSIAELWKNNKLGQYKIRYEQSAGNVPAYSMELCDDEKLEQYLIDYIRERKEANVRIKLSDIKRDFE